jgi:hypothetical protein
MTPGMRVKSSSAGMRIGILLLTRGMTPLRDASVSRPRKEKGVRNRHNIMSNWSDEETDEPLIADHRNFYKVEKWSRDGQRVTELLFAGSSLNKAKRVFDRWAKHRPRIRMTIRQRTRVLDEWPLK